MSTVTCWQPSPSVSPANVTSLKPFDPPTWINKNYPKVPLSGEENWLSWSMIMKQIFELADVWKVVTGEETQPSQAVHSPEYENWRLKDGYAKLGILHNVDSNLLPKLANKSSSEMWTHLRNQYQQVGSGSIVPWFRKLIRSADASPDMKTHTQEFETALRDLANADINFPEYIQSCFLLSTLPDDSAGLNSWMGFISNLRINESTKLSSTIAAILEEARIREVKASSKANNLKDAMAVPERLAIGNSAKKFCQHCNKEGHNLADCWSQGGAKEDPKPKKKQKRAKKGKKEDAKAAEGSDSESRASLRTWKTSSWGT